MNWTLNDFLYYTDDVKGEALAQFKNIRKEEAVKRGPLFSAESLHKVIDRVLTQLQYKKHYILHVYATFLGQVFVLVKLN